jgi:hypothetical protein
MYAGANMGHPFRTNDRVLGFAPPEFADLICTSLKFSSLDSASSGLGGGSRPTQANGWLEWGTLGLLALHRNFGGQREESLHMK